MTTSTSALSPTGRVPSQPAIQRLRSTSLTPAQRQTLERLKGDVLEWNGRTYTRSELMSIFCGQQVPKDPKLCKFLGLDLDFTSLELRIAGGDFSDRDNYTLCSFADY